MVVLTDYKKSKVQKEADMFRGVIFLKVAEFPLSEKENVLQYGKARKLVVHWKKISLLPTLYHL